MRTKCPEWCGKCYANGRRKANYPGHRGYQQPSRPYVEPWWEMLKRAKAASNDQASKVGVAPRSEFDGYPNLWDFLTQAVWPEDGKKRTPGTMMVMVDDGLLKVMLNDKDQSRVAFSVVDASEGILEHAEAMLVSTNTDWRASRGKR